MLLPVSTVTVLLFSKVFLLGASTVTVAAHTVPPLRLSLLAVHKVLNLWLAERTLTAL